MSNFKRGFLITVLSLFCFSIIEVVGSLAYEGGIGPMSLLTIRFIIASVLFFLTLLVMKRRNKKIFKIDVKDIGKLLLHTCILVVHLILFWRGIKEINHVPTALGIYFIYPFTIVLLKALFFKEKLNRTKKVSLALGIVGMLFAVRYLPVFSLSGINVLGASLMFGASLSWPLYMLVGEGLLKKYHPFTILFYNSILSVTAYLLLQSFSVTLSEITPSSLYYVSVMGVVSTYLAYLTYYIGIKSIKSSNVGIIGFVKPLISMCLAFMLLHQTVTFFQFLGTCLIVSGVYLLYRGEKS